MKNKYIVDDQIHSSEINNIIGKVPHWIVRRGIMALCFLFFIVFSIANYVKYPTIIVAKFNVNPVEEEFKMKWKNFSTNTVFNPNKKFGDRVSTGDTILIEHNLLTHKSKFICAPMNGKITYEESIQGFNVLLIKPNKVKYLLFAKIPYRQKKDVKIHQKVLLNLDQFQNKKIYTYVSSISIENVNDSTVIYLDYENMLMIDKNLINQFDSVLNGSCEIITGYKSFYEEVVHKIY